MSPLAKDLYARSRSIDTIESGVEMCQDVLIGIGRAQLPFSLHARRLQRRHMTATVLLAMERYTSMIRGVITAIQASSNPLVHELRHVRY
jgi:hypothetical protein